MLYLMSYVAALLVFGAVDATWLLTVGASLYRPVLGDMLAPSIRIAPAITFYLMYPIGLVVFAIVPALKADSSMTALFCGALFGALAYATYDLTNHAVMRVWSLQITLVDIAYGAAASGVASLVAYFLVRSVSGWLGFSTH